MSSLSPEVQTLERCRAQINNVLAAMVSLQWFGGRLLDKNFISPFEYVDMCCDPPGSYTQTKMLMERVILQIRFTPAKFADFISILQEKPVLSDLVKLLGDTCGKRSSQDSLPTYKHFLIDFISGYWGYLHVSLDTSGDTWTVVAIFIGRSL